MLKINVEEKQVNQILKESNRLVLIAGSVGSGRSTAMNHLRSKAEDLGKDQIYIDYERITSSQEPIGLNSLFGFLSHENNKLVFIDNISLIMNPISGSSYEELLSILRKLNSENNLQFILSIQVTRNVIESDDFLSNVKRDLNNKLVFESNYIFKTKVENGELTLDKVKGFDD